jgi:hypothetical protein
MNKAKWLSTARPTPPRLRALSLFDLARSVMPLPVARGLAIAVLCATFPAGCNPMNSEPRQYTDFDYPPAGTPSPSGVVPAHVPTLPNGQVHIDTRKPIPFDRHNFDSYCFDTYGCNVRYAGLRTTTDPDDERRPSSASYGNRYPDLMGGAGISSIRNFPLPAEVRWRDKDGNPHEATVDIAAIFKDQVVLHKVPQEQLPPILTAPVFPKIVLEVNDRTINVWMRAHVPTTVLQKPGNQYSDFRSDMILAYTQTY